MNQPLCFVLMPFGKKPGAAGAMIDFDAVYRELIAPAIEEAALKDDEQFLAQGLLDKSIEAYLSGFEADWRDAHPGINAVTLLEPKEPPDPRREQIIPVVAYAVERRITAGKPDYWDHATRLELAVLAKDEQAAMAALGDALASIRETWEGARIHCSKPPTYS